MEPINLQIVVAEKFRLCAYLLNICIVVFFYR